VRWLAAATVAAVTMVAIANVTGAPASDITMLCCTAVAAVGFFRARGASELGRSLTLLGWSAAGWGAGVGLWLGVESLSRSTSGLNPVSGSVMLAGSCLALAGVLTLPGAPASAGSRLRLALDCLLVAVSILFVAWRPFVEPAMAHSHRGLATCSRRCRCRSPTPSSWRRSAQCSGARPGAGRWSRSSRGAPPCARQPTCASPHTPSADSPAMATR
jgi:hypothetical protein